MSLGLGKRYHLLSRYCKYTRVDQRPATQDDRNWAEGFWDEVASWAANNGYDISPGSVEAQVPWWKPGSGWQLPSQWHGASPGTNPPGPPLGESRVRRGGSWRSGASACRVAYRDYASPSSPYGFRLVRAAGQ